MEKREHPLIPFKKAVNVRSLNKYIDKGMTKLRQHYHTSPVGAEFSTFTHDLLSIFPVDKVRYDVLFSSVMTLAGSELTPDIIRQTVWRLAANMDKLYRGTPVPQWTRQTTLEWVGVVLQRAQLSRSAKGRLGFWYDYRVLSGSPAGLRFRQFWTLKYIKFLARSLGFTRGGRGKYRFHDGHELVNMRLYLLLDPALSTDEKPGHYHFFVPTSCKAANQKILKQRVRITPCPYDFPLATVPCYKCPIGYSECKAGCHPLNYTTKACPRCMETEAWFDPLGKGTICIECEEKAALTVVET